MGEVSICAKVQRYKCDVETVYLDTHNSNKLEEADQGKLVNLPFKSLFVRSYLLSLYYLIVSYTIYCMALKDKVEVLSVKR